MPYDPSIPMVIQTRRGTMTGDDVEYLLDHGTPQQVEEAQAMVWFRQTAVKETSSRSIWNTSIGCLWGLLGLIGLVMLADRFLNLGLL